MEVFRREGVESKITAVTLGLIQSCVWGGIGHCTPDFLKTSMSVTVETEETDPKVAGQNVLIRLKWMGRQADNPTGMDIVGEWRVLSGEILMASSMEDQFVSYGFRIGREVEKILTEWVVDSGTNAWFYSRSHGFMEHFSSSLQRTMYGFTVGFTEHIDPHNPTEALRIDIKWPEARNGLGDLATCRIVTWTDVTLHLDNMEAYFRSLGENVSQQMWGAVENVNAEK